MINNKTAVIDLQFDVREATANLVEVSSVLDGLKRKSTEISGSFSKSFTPILISLNSIQSGIRLLVDSLNKIVEKLYEVKTSAEETANTGSLFDSISTAYDAIGKGVAKYEAFEKTSKNLDYIATYFALAENTGDLVKNMFPKASSLADTVSEWTTTMLFPSISDGLAKISPSLGKGAETMLGSITSAFGKIGSVFSNMSVGWGLVIAAIVAGVILIIQNWDTIKAAIGTAAEWVNVNIVQPVIRFFTNLWTRVVTVVDSIVKEVTLSFNQFGERIQLVINFAQSIFAKLGDYLKNAFAKDWTEQFGAFGNILNAFFANVENVWNAVKMIFSGIVTFVKNIFAGDWKGAWDGIVQIFLGIWEGMQAAIKWPINGIIGVINGLVSAVVSGINGAIKALNKLKFTVPDWVPVIGGKYFGFNIGLLTAPQIPYLAKGAVLPANKPFLAMVGDQKHGTNIEAPLATIQDAVALVMNDQAAAMMAGFEAVVRAINEKNATLELDGREIWAAYNAYNRKAAVVRGHIGFRKLWSKRQEQGFLKLIAKNGRPVIGLIPMKGGDSHADVTRRRGKRLRFLVSALIMVPKGAW